ncbi:ATP-binding protein [Paraflavisolibacter sp. H34]|uniref:ATP-binding protein n=1 Tax=Huijunlia imazamoxiresistens TaxID=3127457 RepID=UPI0030172163
MQEIVRVTLENEMDLVLAHRRSMKLAELTGMSLSAQTTFATAVSEVSRITIENGKNGCLVLGISSNRKQEKYLVAALKDEGGGVNKANVGLDYAKKLANKFNISKTETVTFIELYFALPAQQRIDAATIEVWKEQFGDDRPVSPYDEIKRKNEQLRDLAQKLQESESKYKTLTNSLPLIIFTLDKEGKIAFVNEWTSQYTGVKFEEAQKEDWREVLHEADRAAFALLLNDQVTGGTFSVKTQCRLRQADTQEYLWHLVSITPLRDENGAPYQWIGYAVDIHAQKVYEETLQDNRELKRLKLQLEESKWQLEQHVRELNRSNFDLQQFAFIASHDLQEPVRKVAYYSDMLGSKYGDALDDKGRGYLQSLQLASFRMRTLINDVLSFSQVSRDSLNFEPVNLREVVSQVVTDFELSVAEKGADIRVEALPKVEADKAMMAQVFGNLISNSLKYGKEGEPPQISITSEISGNNALITVNDNGIGFDGKYAVNMFNLFQRLHSRDRYEGTGLGLAICRKIVELHHGTITAEGAPDKGASFTISLPLKQAFS